MNEQDTTEPTPEINPKHEAMKSKLASLKEALQEQITAASLRLALLEQHKDFFFETEISPSICNDLIDFDFLDHKNIIKVIRQFGGKWKKEYVGESVNYETIINGIKMRCYCGKPPPNCKVVEYEEIVPEQIVAAHTVKKRRLQCIETVTPTTIES